MDKYDYTNGEKSERRILNFDQQAWIHSIVHSSIAMAIAINSQKITGMDNTLADEAIFGLIEGSVKEIAKVLNMYLEVNESKKDREVTNHNLTVGS